MKYIRRDLYSRCAFLSEVLLFLFLGTPCVTYGAIFEPVEQVRVVGLSGSLNLLNLETQKASQAAFNEVIRSLPSSWAPLRSGMNISLPEGVGFGQGVASQALTVSADCIKFSGLADVNISGFSGYPYEIEGNGGASVNMEYKFSVAKDQDVELSMDSMVDLYRDEDFIFSLASSDKNIIWASTAVVGVDGEIDRSFSKTFFLRAGEYTISTQLMAGSYVSGGMNFAGRTRADFSITAVPEPNAGALATLGLALIGYTRYRNRK